jgi:hypothetical protein
MYLILFLVGVVLAFAGALLVHSSVPVEDIPKPHCSIPGSSLSSAV